MFCESNIKSPKIKHYLQQHGPIRSLPFIFDKIDEATRDEVIELISPDKNRAWNLRPAKEGKAGSIEFRRPPGVASAQNAKHWIAFTMAFVYMAICANPSKLSQSIQDMQSFEDISHPDFLDDIKRFASELGIVQQLKLDQPDDIEKLHFSILSNEGKMWLRSLNKGYQV